MTFEIVEILSFHQITRWKKEEKVAPAGRSHLQCPPPPLCFSSPQQLPCVFPSSSLCLCSLKEAPLFNTSAVWIMDRVEHTLVYDSSLSHNNWFLNVWVCVCQAQLPSAPVWTFCSVWFRPSLAWVELLWSNLQLSATLQERDCYCRRACHRITPIYLKTEHNSSYMWLISKEGLSQIQGFTDVFICALVHCTLCLSLRSSLIIQVNSLECHGISGTWMNNCEGPEYPGRPVIQLWAHTWNHRRLHAGHVGVVPNKS